MIEEQPETKEDLVNQARLIAERLEKANAESKSILERAEKLNVIGILGGKSVAGLAPKTQEEKDQEAADRFIRRLR